MFFWFYALFTFQTSNVDIKEIDLYNNFVKELVNSNGTTLEIEIIINQFENSTPNYQKDGVDQVPFSVGMNGVVPFLIRGNRQAYVVEKGSTTNN